MAGCPCQPFSASRCTSGTTKTQVACSHPQYDIVMETLPALLARRTPRVAASAFPLRGAVGLTKGRRLAQLRIQLEMRIGFTAVHNDNSRRRLLNAM